MSSDHTTVPDRLHVHPADATGPHPVTPVSEWWLPILGPTASVLAATLAESLPTTAPRTRTWDTRLLAQRIGLTDNRARLWQSLNRLERFGAGWFHGTDVFMIRLSLPELTPRQLGRLPDDMSADYRAQFLEPVRAGA